MKEYEIIPLEIAESKGYKFEMTYLTDFDKTQKRVSYIWYIVGSEREIIVDTGVKVESFAETSISVRQLQDPSEALAKVDSSPDDIDIVILSHLHFDHVQNAELFSEAKFLFKRRN